MPAEPRDEHEETVLVNEQSGDATHAEPESSTIQFPESAGGRAPAPANPTLITRLGRFRLVRELGRGGMGAVYLGEDDRDGRQVAIKVLSPDIVPNQDAVQRFQKEARLLSEVRHPHVTNLLEVGEHEGISYLTFEFVDGVDLKQLLSKLAPLRERLALQIIRDVAQALATTHEQGIIHRDIKPSNILMTAATAGGEPAADAVTAAVESGCQPVVKLTDFGLARHVRQSASLDLTRTGAIVGTPTYMAPEQCSSTGVVGPGTDVYALGATLFEMLSGRPPFEADDPLKIISAHCLTEPPDLRKLNPEVSDGVAQLVNKSLQKRPDNRFADGAHLLADIDRLLRGETNDVTVHPRTPEPGGALLAADWEWKLQSTPQQLWPWVSNTERINCAVGVPAVEYTTDRDEFGAVRKFGTFKLGWATLKWEEHPFEWIEGRRLGVLRVFQRGPFEWFLSIVELAPQTAGGTLLTHRVRIATRGLLGRLLAHIEVNVKGRKALDRIYERIDAVASGRLRGSPAIDPIEPPARLTRTARRRLETRRELLQRRDVDPQCEERLAEFISDSPHQELARIRPHELARRLRVRPEKLTEACLHACRVGLLELHWDILCPTCRISASVQDTIDGIEAHAYCEACDLDFDVNFGNAVELMFRVHPEFRQADLKTYCIGGPEHAPHVVSQVRMAVDECLELDVALDAGTYVLRGPQLPYAARLVVESGRGVARAHLTLSKFLDVQQIPTLRAGRALLTLENKHERPLLLRIERTILRTDVVTAADASRLPLFQELFPGEVLSRDRLAEVSTSTLLAVRVVNSADLYERHGDARALQMMRDRTRAVRQTLESHGGAVVRERDERLLASFTQSVSAVRAALEIRNQQSDDLRRDDQVLLRIALHRGTTLTTTIDGRLDYVGRTVNTIGEVIDADSGGTLVLTDELLTDKEITGLFRESGLRTQQRPEMSVLGTELHEVTADATDSTMNLRG